MHCFDLAAIGLHLASVHTGAGYNDFNPGLYVEGRCGFLGGVYYNSYRRASAQVAWRGEPRKVPLFIELGLATGYPGHAVEPYAMAGLRMGPVRLGVVPHVPGLNRTVVVHAMVQLRL